MLQNIRLKLVIMQSACICVVSLPCSKVRIVDIIMHDVEFHHGRKCLELLSDAEEEVNSCWFECMLQKIRRLESEAYI